MRNALILSTVVLASGCTPSLSRTLDAAEKALAGVHAAVDLAVDIDEAAVEVLIARCGELPSEQERRDCFGPFADRERVDAALEQLSSAYDAAVVALDEARKAAAALDDHLRRAARVAKENNTP